ncbi:unnamed protein product [Prorocentrum cordatum]|uniref:Uncharacterized protein n=1 Tax=Prorocentrum cordatum TaxID=2364126 RepID=A0ABN9XU66_9DINO|nr:unnamed protein product [Polarella glacialis]
MRRGRRRAAGHGQGRRWRRGGLRVRGRRAGPGPRGPPKESAPSCQDTQEGLWCYRAIAWLKHEGVAKHPTWYPTLTVSSSVPAFQKVLHQAGKSGCPLPCAEIPEEKDNRLRDMLASSWDDTVTTAPPSSTTTDIKEYYGKEEGIDCQGLIGDQCFVAVSWALAEGIKKHPDWYPELSAFPSFREVQVPHLPSSSQRRLSCPPSA